MAKRTLTLDAGDMEFIGLVLDLHADNMKRAADRAHLKGDAKTEEERISAMKRALRLRLAAFSAQEV